MRHFASISAFAAVAAFTFLSCARVDPEDTVPIEQQAFEAWVEKHIAELRKEGVPEEKLPVKQANGTYVEFLSDGDQTIESSCDKELWLALDYTSRDNQGNVFATRNETEALRQGTFTPYTHYTPVFTYVSPSMAGIPEGQLYALTNRLEKGDGTTVKLSKGSQVRLYMPSHMAYGEDGYSDNQGYGGQYSLGATKIVVDDLTVVDVVEDPVARETELVEAHAATWDLTAEDTFGFNEEIYVDSVKFEQLLQQERPELLAEYPILPRKTGVAKDDNGNVVKDDEGNDKIVYTDYYSLNTQSTASIRYVGRFLPSPEYPEGFIFDTNIESVYDKFYNRRKGYPAIEQEFPALEYTPSTDKEELIFAFYELVPNVRRGKWYRMVFTSEYGYGGDGLSSGSASYASGKRPTTEISPYTPLVFEIYIEPVSESESK